MSKEIVIVSAYRTAIGSFNGSLAGIPASKLGEAVIKHVIEKSGINAKDISEVILGQVLTGNNGQNPARQASMGAGLPKEVPAWLINQVCGSGLRAVALGCQSILTGQSSIVIAGGQESMSSTAHAIFMRNGYKMGNTEIADMMIKDGLTDAFSPIHMGVTAENIAERFKISREEQDRFAVHSQNKAEAAYKAGKFQDEIVPIKIIIKKEEVEFKNDEYIRLNANYEEAAKLRPAFKKEGTVTAANSSGINDGAAVVMLMAREEAELRGLEILGVIRSFAQSGVEPEIMGTGPIKAVERALEIANWKIKDLDLIEANEAFAAQAICVNKELGWDINKVNVNGGAIALGHPIGASGARILVTLLHEMRKQNAKKGLATLCVGGGMGIAMCIERN